MNSSLAQTVSLYEVEAAARRIAGAVHRTPVARCSTLDRLAGRQLLFKCEHLQRIGAFKFRGALSFLSALEPREAAAGAVTHSSGNHAQALALAARQLGMRATVVMPRDASRVKVAAVREYGAEIVRCEPTPAARAETAETVVRERDGVLVPPYDHPQIIAGQGTVALELFDQCPDLDAIVAPVGGGGLMSGICVAARALSPRTRLIGAEPVQADDAARSLAAGRRLDPLAGARTLADGLRTGLGELTWPILRDHLDALITVGEEQIVEAMRLLWQRAKLLVEPSAAVGLAAVLSPAFAALGPLRRVGIVLSGGNVDLDALPW